MLSILRLLKGPVAPAVQAAHSEMPRRFPSGPATATRTQVGPIITALLLLPRSSGILTTSTPRTLTRCCHYFSGVCSFVLFSQCKCKDPNPKPPAPKCGSPDYKGDGNCDDGRPGSMSDFCDFGTDCSDCGDCSDCTIHTNFCQSAIEATNPSLILDLQQDRTVTYVVVWNRQDPCCRDRLGYHTISWATEASPQTFTVCAESTAPATNGPFTHACPHEARYIKLELPGTSRTLNLAEVEVYVVPFSPSPPLSSPLSCPDSLSTAPPRSRTPSGKRGLNCSAVVASAC